MNAIASRKTGVYCLVGFALWAWSLASPTNGQETGVITVEVRENQGIREISKEYLDDADLWVDVLRANHLKSPHEVRPGMVLRIPTEAIFQAKRELEISRKLIQQATKAGAKIFAPKIIERAIGLRESAIEKRKSGDWLDCAGLARSAADEAKEALRISKSNQDVSAEAMVRYRQGNVHSRKPSEDLWKDVSQYDILLEGERVRTLSRSNASILFRDDSLLQLKENAQALIQKMRTNLLQDTEEAKVTLIKGDVFALLAQGKKDDQFRLDVPGVETKINSQNFWVGRDEQGARFANYDGELEVSSAGSKVVLKENQGSIVPRDRKPTPPRDLLPSPRLVKPENGDQRFDVNTPLVWTEIEKAEHYLLEFAREGLFSNIIWSQNFREAKAMFPRQLGGGTFFWRVTAFSSDKLPGRPSRVRFFRIMDDDKPPFLVVQSPEEGAVFSEGTAEILGSTESDVAITVQGQQVEAATEGKFRYKHALSPGENLIVVKAVDKAGNATEVSRKVTYLPENEINLSFDASLQQIGPNHFVVGQQGFALVGKTEPYSIVGVSSLTSTFFATTTADDKGHFQINVRLTGQRDEFTIEITSRTGRTKKEQFVAEIDNKAPVIYFSEKIPSATAQKKLMISGKVEGTKSLTLNGKNLPLKDGEFFDEVQLESGMNTLRFLAFDSVQNITVVEKKIVLDLDPPGLIHYELLLDNAKGGEEVSISVQAMDATGLGKVASFSVQVGEFSHTGNLILSDPKGHYTGSFRVPRKVKGEVKLRSIRLSDYLGNSKEYAF